MEMRSGLRMAVLLLCAGLAFLEFPAFPASASPREESERLRADMEGQSERLRLNVETFMIQQDHRVGATLAAQDRRIDDLHRAVLALAGLGAGLVTLAAVLAVLLGRSRRRSRPMP